MSDPKSLSGGRYQLVARLGEGGMATVYRAFDTRLQVWRAIKVLLPQYARKRKLMSRFEAEAQTMALLEHPHIVRVYDVDRDEDHAFIVMELVEGGSLVEWLEQHGAMPPRMAVDVMVEVCQAIQFAHDHGVIHRDIKPHNVMVDVKGTCRVTDFGIARAGDGDQSLTKTGAVMGTWGYMAPEQRTDAKNVDARADVYALAATLFSLITDRTPMDLFAADRDPALLSGVPDSLLPLVRRATDWERDRRPASAKELAAAMLAVREELPPTPAGTPSLVPSSVVRTRPPPKPDAAEEEEGAGPGLTILPEEPGEADLDTAAPATQAPARPMVAVAPPATPAAPAAPATPAPPVTAGPEQAPTAKAAPPVEPPPSVLASGQDQRLLRVAGALLVGCVVLLAALLVQSTADRPPAPDPIAITTPTPVEAAAVPVPTSTPTPAAAVVAVEAPQARSTPRPTATPIGERPPVATPRPTPTPAVEVPPAPAVEAQCFKSAQAFMSNNQRLSMAVRATTCIEAADITLHYRASAGGPWFQKGMVMRLNAWSTVVDLTGELTGGVDWYLSSAGVTHGSTTRPKHYQPPAE